MSRRSVLGVLSVAVARSGAVHWRPLCSNESKRSIRSRGVLMFALLPNRLRSIPVHN